MMVYMIRDSGLFIEYLIYKHKIIIVIIIVYSL